MIVNYIRTREVKNMEPKIITESEFNSNFINRIMKLRLKIEEDKLIYGDAFIQVTDNNGS